MLAIKRQRKVSPLSWIMTFVGVGALGAGLYLLLLVATPELAPYISMKPLDASAVAAIKVSDDKVIIPKIGVNIAYGPKESSLDRGAWWRHSERGNPETGGNFILAAHRFTLASTPQETNVKSPFYHIDRLVVGDEIIVDYNGKRYGYKIDTINNVKPDHVEIEAPSETPKLTLYTCSLGGASDGRVVLTAKPLGPVTMTENGMSVEQSSANAS